MEKQSVAEELRELLVQWELLLKDTSATQEQYTLLHAKIANLCDKLDALDVLR